MSIRITYFVHGTTTDNEKGLATGWEQGRLSDLGIEQSRKLPTLLKQDDFDIVFCSDLKRAIDSAHLAFGDKYKIVTDKRLREANYGDFTLGKEFKDGLKKYIDTPFPNGESYKDVEKRIREFVDFLKESYQGKHIAIVAHQAPQLALDVILGGKTWEQAIDEDWRKKKAWQPGWTYLIKDSFIAIDYDPIAKEYHDYGNDRITDMVLGYENLVKLLESVKGKKILDYGCGSGKFSRMLSDKGAEVVGFDPSKKGLELASENNDDGIIYTNKLEPLQDYKFDSCVMNFVLCTIHSKDQISEILSRINGLLKEKGQLIILNSNYKKSNGKQFISFEIAESHDLTSGKTIKVMLGKDRKLVVEDYYWSLEDYTELLEKTGFRVDKVLEPLAEGNDLPWIDEVSYPPFIIISAVKE